MEEDRISRAKRFAEIWWKSRAQAGVSQEYMALGLGVSKKTIQNWEKGTSSPTFFQGLEWFNVLGINPLSYYFDYIYSCKRADDSDDEKVTELLVDLVKNIPIDSQKKLLYYMSGEHGSSPHSVLQLMMAHLHTPMRDRVTTASVVMQNYELSKKLGTTVHPEKALPDEEQLRKAIEKGKEAIINQREGYVLSETKNF